MKAHGLGQSALLLLDVASVLTRNKIRYAVIGAMAASVHGSIRATTDADAVLSLTAPKLRALEKTLKKAGLQTAIHRGDTDDPIPALLAVSDRHGNRVDLLAGLRGLDPKAFSRAVWHTVLYWTCWVVLFGIGGLVVVRTFA